MTIKTKYSLMGAIVLIGFSGMAATTVIAMREAQTLNRLTTGARALVSEFLQLSSLSKDLLITANLEVSLEQWDASRQKFETLHGSFSASSLLRVTFVRAGKSELLDSFESDWDLAKPGLENVGTLVGDLIKAYGADNAAVPGLMLGYARFRDSTFTSGTSTVKVLLSSNKSLSKKLEEIAVVLTDIVEKKVSTQVLFVIFTAIAVTFAMLTIFLLFALSLVRRLATIDKAMRKLQEKDFTLKIAVSGNDELARMASALNGFIDDFSSVIRGVKNVSVESFLLKNEVTSASTESAAAVTEMTASIGSISKRIRDLVEHLQVSNGEIQGITGGIDSLATRIHSQSSFVSRSTASVEQMTTSIRSVAAITATRAAAVGDLVKTTKSGGAVIEETAASLNAIFLDLGKINEIIAMIDGIASMTNLLAMNAAIEAAHAGASGRGFAVVADEIRKLAESTNGNAKSIKDMIQGVSSKMAGVLERSEKSRTAFGEVDREVDSTSRAMAEIARAMEELTQGGTEIIASMSNLTKNSEALVEETERMRTHTDQVLAGMGKIEEISSMVSNGIAEIEIGTKEINAAMSDVNELQARNGESVERVLHEVSNFRTKDDMAPAVE